MDTTAATSWTRMIRPTPGLLALALVLSGCDAPNSVVATPEATRFDHIVVNPTSVYLSVAAPSNTFTLTISAWNDHGAEMSLEGGVVTYQSSAPGVVSVNDAGVLTASAVGTAKITATLRLDGTARSAYVHVSVVASGPWPSVAGVYDLNALITGFDPAWGDMTGTRQVAVVHVEQPGDGPQLTGTFSDFRAVSPNGEESEPQPPGTVSGYFTSDGHVVLELTNQGMQTSYWYGSGTLTPSGIEGTFGAGGHITGTFTATRR